MPQIKNQLLTNEIWKSLNSAAKRARRPLHVAVAYFGQGASKLLPLRANSRLVVDASDNAVKSGQTHPADLKLLQKRGVIIYSVPNLHVKIYVCDEVALVGSANVSNRSAGTLIESMLRTTDPRIVRSAKPTNPAGATSIREQSRQTLSLHNKISSAPNERFGNTHQAPF
jgi:hypothetical protein